MSLSKKLLNLNIFALCFAITSCSSIETTLDSISDSVESAGDYLYDSVNFWEDEEEPEQSDAVIIEEAVEVPEFALPDQDYFDQNQDTFDMGQPQNFAQPAPAPYFNPIYRSQRQYYYVGPNGTPMPAPAPPPFPQYSIDQQQINKYNSNMELVEKVAVTDLVKDVPYYLRGVDFTDQMLDLLGNQKIMANVNEALAVNNLIE